MKYISISLETSENCITANLQFSFSQGSRILFLAWGPDPYFSSESDPDPNFFPESLYPNPLQKIPAQQFVYFSSNIFSPEYDQ